MDWSILTTAFAFLIGGLVSAGSVWLKGRSDAKIEREKIEADARSREHEQKIAIEQQEKQVEREDRQRGKEAGLVALTTFSSMLKEISGLADDVTPLVVAHRWRTRLEAEARRTVESISDRNVREGMLTVLNALGNFADYSGINGQNLIAGYNARGLVQLLVELAGAAARGEAVSPTVQAKVDDCASKLRVVDHYYENNI
ncbi:hypothetical protein HD600_000213 [Microbacterium ginsengiterrae]|uniref:Uncharacterized protein n=1 Tax=Microbacterium ginsengiterrae TaxID=546115 RepID=A0A7W9F9Y7_9MICO|nr:hypothetical protein [Microbacterium ginsengiterrae]MBB5741716.1 hypothetical protein [Microbacterium ginsengiterrae]